MQSIRSPIPILFVDHAAALGGAEHSLLLILKNLDRTKWQPHLACVEGLLAEAGCRLNVPVHKIVLPRLRRSPSAITSWWRGAHQLANVAKNIDATILIANTVRAALYTALASLTSQRPFVWHMRDFWLSETEPAMRWSDTLGKRILNTVAKQVIANSQTVASHLPNQAKVTVVHNGIDLQQFDPDIDGTSFRHQHNIPVQATVIGMVGRLRPWKGQDRFLRLAAQIHKSWPDVYFIVVGGSPFDVADGYSKRLQTLVNDLGLIDQVIFTEHLRNVQLAIAAMDIFVHPGEPEPFGLVNIEAMAMRKPVIARSHGALPEIVLNNETGLLALPENEVQLAELIIQLIEDKPQRLAFGRAGRLRVEQNFQISQTVQGVESVLSNIATSHL